MDFSEFILLHDEDDLGRLALSRERFAADVPDFDLALTTLEARRKLRTKVPEWYAVPGLHYPTRLSAQQCSSTETAQYKASVAQRTILSAKTQQNALKMGPEDNLKRKNAAKCALDGTLLADLTGGLGVDSWAFAQVFEKVLYNEMNPALCEAARHNFELLGADNICVRNSELRSPIRSGMTGDFQPDILYLDPARRAADGRKVFRLEECQPDVLTLLPELLEACPHLLLKLSPMADITLVCKQLGCVKEVHAVAAEGECKELLLVLERGYEGQAALVICENGHAQILRCAQNDEGSVFATAEDLHGWLFEPGKALLKSGAFHWPSSAFGLKKLGRHTHLYVSAARIDELAPFGKWFPIERVVPLDKRHLKETARSYPQADVSAHNLPLSSEALRSRLGVKDGGDHHLFGARIDVLSENFLLITVKCK